MPWRSHFIAIYFIALTGMQLSAQDKFETVDRKAVEIQINDASLGSFYPSLLERFNTFDTTLTLADYRLLYYGFVFQPAYLANADQKRKEMNVAMKAERYDEVLLLADSVLQTNPVSLTANYFRAYAMINANEQDSSYLKYENRYSGIRNAILSSGDGQHCNTAYKTIYVADEYEIMYNYFEMDRNQTQTLEYPCDRFSVTPPSGTYTHTEIYFDVSESLLHIEKELKSDTLK
jgi:hypothetical protein